MSDLKKKKKTIHQYLAASQPWGWLLLHPWVHTYGPCDVHAGLHLAKKVIYMPWGGGAANAAAPAPASMCCSDWSRSPARPPASRQLGSGFSRRRPPWKALIDWRLIFLTGSWNPATKTREQRRGSGGATKLFYDREGERQGTNVQGKERKMSLLMFVRWYRLRGSNLGLVFPLQGGKKKKKKPWRDSVGTRAQVRAKMKKRRKTFYQTIFISSRFSFFPEYEHSDKIKKEKKKSSWEQIELQHMGNHRSHTVSLFFSH